MKEKKYILSGFADEASADIEGQIRAMKENGLSALELRGIGGKNVTELSISEFESIVRSLNDASLYISSIGSPIGKIDIGDDFERHFDIFKKLVEFADISSTKYMRIFSFYGVDSDEKEIEVYRRLNILSEYAKGAGVILCHENEKGIFGETPENCLKIFSNVQGICGVFDPANFVQCNVDTKVAWNMLSEHIEYLHIKDALADKSVVPAGIGIGNLEYVMSQYSKTGKNLYSLEPHLRIFEGFSKLERKNEKTCELSAYTFDSGADAFRASANAAKEILNKIYR